jgi:hypothetical protein
LVSQWKGIRMRTQPATTLFDGQHVLHHRTPEHSTSCHPQTFILERQEYL